MGRYNSTGSHWQTITYMGHDWYRLAWVVDRYYKGSRLRFPTRYTRDTDELGAKRFAKKWNIELPENKK